MASENIEKCDCEHEYQDQKYGKKNRLHNKGVNKTRCTVCSKDKKK